MKIIIYIVLVLVAGVRCVNAQSGVDFNNYVPLKCRGAIPQDFKTELSKMVEMAKQEEDAAGKKEKKRAADFAELSSYQLNNILFSGKVLYGDMLTEYVNKVADIVLQNEPDLRQKVRFYVLKNTDLNAYSTQSGVIFVSIGLLAQIESEAQLAFVLCHEVVHFRNNHNLESYRKRQDVMENRKSKVNPYERLNSILNFSKEHELEADREGLELFLKTPYSTNELNNLFDVMLYSYLPFDEIHLDTGYFNSGTRYSLPRKYFPDEVSAITAEEDVSDTMSTHPNIRRRKEAIRKLLLTDHHDSGQSFILSMDEFGTMQRAARCEVAIAYLQDAEFEESFYCAYLLEKTYGRHLFSDKIVCTSLYALAKQKNFDMDRTIKRYMRTSEDSKSGEYWEIIEGESQAIYHFIMKIPAKELNILATSKMLEAWHIHRDPFFAMRLKNLVQDLVIVHGLEKSMFLPAPHVIADTVIQATPLDMDTASENTRLTKVLKIRKTRMERAEKQETAKKNEYYKYAFSANYDDSLWKEAFVQFSEAKRRKESQASSTEFISYTEEKERIIDKHGEGLDIHKFVMLNPFYSSYIRKYFYFSEYRVKNPKVSPLEETGIQQELAAYFMGYARQLEMEVEVIGINQQASIETDQFNDYQQIVSWFSERMALGTLEAMTYNEQYMEKYADQYGHIAFCYVVNLNKSLEMVFMLVDMKTGSIEYTYDRELRKGKPNSVHMRMAIYELLHQIRQSPDKINKLKRKYGIRE